MLARNVPSRTAQITPAAEMRHPNRASQKVPMREMYHRIRSDSCPVGSSPDYRAMTNGQRPPVQ